MNQYCITACRVVHSIIKGGAENAGVENGGSRQQGWKMQEWKMQKPQMESHKKEKYKIPVVYSRGKKLKKTQV